MSNGEEDNNNNMVRITLRTIGPSPPSSMDLHSPIKVRDLRKLISGNGRMPLEKLRLVLQGNVLHDTKYGEDISVHFNNGDTLIVAVKPKPPAKHIQNGLDDDEEELKFEVPELNSRWKRRLFITLHDKLKIPDMFLVALFSLSLKAWAVIIMWFIFAPIAHKWDVGPLYILGTGFAIIFMNLGKRQQGDMSAYSIFNEDFRELPGTFNAERVDRDIRAGLRDQYRSTFQTSMAMNTVVNEVDHVDMLDASFDAYGGVIINMNNDMDENVFTILLQTSISQWRLQGKKGVWLKLPLEQANLVKPAVKEGFWYHHAEPTYVMLVYWLPETTHTLPPNASHRVGVASFVVNDKGEILVVQEKSGAFKGTGVWKLPTGTVEEGEDISEAAIREVKEEAGIDTKFIEVLAFRQSHQSFFSKSDLMFVCMLKPTSFDIQKQDSEIEAAQWMPVEEYANQPFIKKHKSFDYIAQICIAKKDNKYVGFTPLLTTSATSAKLSYLYSNYKLEQ